MSLTQFDAALDFLLRSPEPAVRLLTRRDLLGETGLDFHAVLDGAWVSALLTNRVESHPYRKWTGAFWRLISLVELGIPPEEPRAVRAAETVLDWLCADEHRAAIPVVNGLVRVHACQEGYALAVCSRLGLATDDRVQQLAESLIQWQWPDGGWNCALRASGRRSSFHESLAPMWGLFEFHRATGDGAARDAASRTAELFLEHRLYHALRTGAVIKREWLILHYPPYWHYDILQALLILSRMGLATDGRCDDAVDVLERRRRPDGRWQPGGYWWSVSGRSGGSTEVVDWGRSGPNAMITLNALRVLRARHQA